MGEDRRRVIFDLISQGDVEGGRTENQPKVPSGKTVVSIKHQPVQPDLFSNLSTGWFWDAPEWSGLGCPLTASLGLRIVGHSRSIQTS